jgi:ribonuclease Z
VGDAGQTHDLVPHVRDADMLVIESTYLQRDVDMAHRFAHLTAAQAAHLAREAGVKQLVLTHVSRRYREAEIVDEARAVFSNTVVARDFDHFRILRDQIEHVE